MEDKVVFLDRDGTINIDKGYLDDPDFLVLLPGVSEAIAKLNAAGYRVIVVSNQSGVSRGMYSEETVKAIHDRLIELLVPYGAKLDGIFYCPHHPDDSCNCRKPKTGLVETAVKVLQLSPNWPDCWMIGDKLSDIQLGLALGCKSVLLEDNPCDTHNAGSKSDFYVFSSLAVAVEHILKGEC